MKKFYDVVFVGGGLANILTAFRLGQVRPDIEFLIVENSDRLGGNHTWSFHETDLTALEWAWLAPLVSSSWPATEVCFPSHRRILNTPYHAIRSADLHQRLFNKLIYKDGFEQKAVDVMPTQVTLENGFSIQASCVVDGRGWVPSVSITECFQKFVGLDVVLKQPHGMKHPVLMDATVDQVDGYRFFYLLPWDENSLLVEDTYYSETPFLDQTILKKRIHSYLASKGWVVEKIEREEHGVLSIPLSGKLPHWSEGVPLPGARGGFFHATTGYSLPWAVHFAEAFSHLGTFEAKRVFAKTSSWAERHWRQQSFFRLLNRFMFRGCDPQDRYKILENFYRRSPSMISDFYAGRFSILDKMKFFMNKPPIPLRNALRCFAS